MTFLSQFNFVQFYQLNLNPVILGEIEEKILFFCSIRTYSEIQWKIILYSSDYEQSVTYVFAVFDSVTQFRTMQGKFVPETF